MMAAAVTGADGTLTPRIIFDSRRPSGVPSTAWRPGGSSPYSSLPSFSESGERNVFTHLRADGSHQWDVRLMIGTAGGSLDDDGCAPVAQPERHTVTIRYATAAQHLPLELVYSGRGLESDLAR